MTAEGRHPVNVRSNDVLRDPFSRHAGVDDHGPDLHDQTAADGTAQKDLTRNRATPTT